MSVLLYGGGFNPPHLGHLAALKRAVEALQPDRVFLIPDGTPPHKPLPPETPSAEERLALVRLAFRQLPEAQVQELAIRREGPCYMADTSFILLSFAWIYNSFLVVRGSCQLLAGVLQDLLVSECVFLMHQWRKMYSMSTYSSAILSPLRIKS